MSRLTAYKISYSILALTFGVFAGFRRIGFDLPEYVHMFSMVQGFETLLDKLIKAKDPIVGLIIYFINPINLEEYTLVFLAFSLLTAFGNIFIILSLASIRKTSLYFFSYFIFFYPGLDYSGIRAGLGIVYLCITLKFLSDRKHKNSIVFGLLSSISHFSVLIPLLIASFSKFKLYRYLRYLAIPILILVASQSSLILSVFKQTSHYESGYGSIFAYIMPVMFLTSVFAYDKFLLTDTSGFARSLSVTSLFLACLCVGFAQVNVTVSLRMLQIALYLMLCSVCFSENIKEKEHGIKFISIICYLLSIFMFNYGGGIYNLWAPMRYNFQHFIDVVWNNTELLPLGLSWLNNK